MYIYIYIYKSIKSATNRHQKNQKIYQFFRRRENLTLYIERIYHKESFERSFFSFFIINEINRNFGEII